MATQITSHNQYHTSGLDPTTLEPTPMRMFTRWFDELVAAGVHEPEAMTLSTTALPGERGVGAPRPSARVVLLKRASEDGFEFFTNYGSRKGRELEANPWCALTFYWPALSRSVRVVGRAERVPREASQAYFDTRPVGSRIGAWASPQSNVLASREELEQRLRATEERFGVRDANAAPADTKIPVPDHWGGYVVVPDEVEFWVGRENRLHDRFRYVARTTDTAHRRYTCDPNTTAPLRERAWTVERLAP